MKSRRVLLSSIFASSILFVAGCAHDQKTKTGAGAPGAAPTSLQGEDRQTATQQSAGGQQNPLQGEAIAPAGPGNADLLARKAESYSKSLEEILNKRNSPKQPTPKESNVEWMSKDQAARSTQPESDSTGHPAKSDVKDSKPTVTPAIDVKSPDPQPKTEVATNARTSVPSSIIANAPARVSPVADYTRPQAAEAAPGSVEAFEAKLAKRVKDYPRDVSAQLEYQLWLYLRDQPVPQLSTISSLPIEDREMLTAVMDALANFRNTVRADNNTLLSKKIKPLLDMADRLRSQADLNVPRVAFCKEVRGFGQYEIMEPRFSAMTEAKTILYCEVENFAAQVNEQQQWTSDLKLETVLYSEDSLQVWADKAEQVHDVSRNRRHDFFIRKFVTLPKNLGVGRYLLKVSVTDLQANRIAEYSLPITFVAQQAQ